VAITFLEERKRLRYLFPVLAIVILITVFVIWRGFFAKGKPGIIPETIQKPAGKIEINLQVLKDPLLEELQPFEKVEPIIEEIGRRQNPFIPY